MKNNQEKFFEDNGYSKVTSFLSKKTKLKYLNFLKVVPKNI